MDRQSAKGIERERGEVRYGGEYLIAGRGPWGSRPGRAGEVEYSVDTVDQNCAGLCWDWGLGQYLRSYKWSVSGRDKVDCDSR